MKGLVPLREEEETRKTLSPRAPPRKGHVRTKGEGSSSQARSRILTRYWICCLILDFLASRTERINVVYTTSSVLFCYGSQSWDSLTTQFCFLHHSVPKIGRSTLLNFLESHPGESPLLHQPQPQAHLLLTASDSNPYRQFHFNASVLMYAITGSLNNSISKATNGNYRLEGKVKLRICIQQCSTLTFKIMQPKWLLSSFLLKPYFYKTNYKLKIWNRLDKPDLLNRNLCSLLTWMRILIKLQSSCNAIGLLMTVSKA